MNSGGGVCFGCGSGSGQLISQTQHVDATTTRLTQFEYDWRYRQESVISPADVSGRVVYTKNHYDNLDQVIKVERYHEQDPAVDILIARQEASYDDRGQVYQTKVYAVDPSNGQVALLVDSCVPLLASSVGEGE